MDASRRLATARCDLRERVWREVRCSPFAELVRVSRVNGGRSLRDNVVEVVLIVGASLAPLIRAVLATFTGG